MGHSKRYNVMSKYNKLIIGAFIVLLLTFPISLLIPKRVNNKLQIAGFYESPFNSNALFPLETALNEYKAAFFEKDIELHSEVTIEEYNEWISAKVINGEEPDVFFITSELYSKLYNKGVLKELSPELEKLNDEKKINKEFVKNSGYPSGIYAIPVAVDFSLMAVNKEVLKRFGFEEVSDNWTWSDYQRMCRALGSENMDFGFSWEDAVYSNGGRIIDYLGKEDFLNSTEVLNAVNFVYRLNESGKGQSGVGEFQKGNAAFERLNGVDCINMNFESDDIDFLPMPAGPEGGNISKAECIYICIGSNSENKDKALDFINIVLGNKIQAEIVNSGYGISVKSLSYNLITEDVAKKISALTEKILQKAYIVHRFKDDNYIFDIIDKRIDDAIKGGVRFENTLSELHIEVSRLLSE